ncbi:MAG: type II toxin-antitoxin system HicA family toxin [Synergistaceae bacterium]|nr:type II toxin-antitoxin system HicA family toxin [Synergistaceae bacterium]
MINKKEIVKILKKAGWIETDLGNGSHIVFIHPETRGRTVVPNNKGKDIPKGTLAAIRRQTAIDEIR